ncbi:SapC family protein [Arsukibacterium sp.]|uniref:SapC family protein n=1 Tax=Arsukibacterium sp. TaxID=1977258 RepID=UPI00299DD3A3|nr:SapC family protein [Arsukibacterium sp.]MDX1677326.1 SapC family protein [Arsukibacterium sp.]
MEQKKVVPLNKQQHAKTKISNENAFSHIANEHMLPIVVHEFVVAGAEFPVVFVKDSQNDSFQPVVLLGLAANQNLIIEEGKWQALYVPRVARNYPLVLVQPDPDSDRLVVAVDESSARVNENEGFPLFKDDGSETDYLADRKKQMSDYVEYSQMTRGFSAKLKSLGLIKEQVLTITVDGEPRNINGIHMVDEKKLNELDNDAFLELRKSGFLTAIYAHLMSLQHTQKLVQKLAKPA